MTLSIVSLQEIQIMHFGRSIIEVIYYSSILHHQIVLFKSSKIDAKLDRTQETLGEMPVKYKGKEAEDDQEKHQTSIMVNDGL